MQFLTVVTDQLPDGHGRTIEVPWREAGILQITDSGERLLTMHSIPNITFRIIGHAHELPEIR